MLLGAIKTFLCAITVGNFLVSGRLNRNNIANLVAVFCCLLGVTPDLAGVILGKLLLLVN